MNDKIYNVLFLCTGNSARSIMAESLLNRDGQGRFRAFSAGSHPKGAVHPLALKLLTDSGYPVEAAQSKSWNVFTGCDAPRMDFVFTVCDDAAGEICPVWPGGPVTAHWGIEDPAAATGSALEREAAFVRAFRYLKNRIAAFTALPLAKIDRLALTDTLRNIGLCEGATAKTMAGAATIYHNLDCGTSRNVLALLRHGGFAPRVVEYLKTPPTRETLTRLIAASGLSARDVARKKGTPFAELGLGDPKIDDEAIIDAMMAHPILINRPIVETPTKVLLCRPSDVALDLAPSWPAEDFFKEEGVPFLSDTAAPAEADEYAYTYRSLGGRPAGHGGYALFGEEMLIRTLATTAEMHSDDLKRNLLALLSYRAFRMGARRAWVFAAEADDFFARIGFKPAALDAAPDAVRAAAPDTAHLFSRSIGF